MPPLWTVIIPVYNRLTYLENCLQSVLRQDPGRERMEILVCDDHSSEDVASSVREWGGGRVTFRTYPRHRGQWGNVNAALRRARGEWIHILHDDDFVLPGFYRAMESAAEAAPPSVGVIVCRCVGLLESRQLTEVQIALQENAGALHGWLERVAVRNLVNMPTVVVHRKVYQAIGNYCASIPFCADWDFHVRAAQRFQWWYVPQPLACYRVHGDTVTADAMRQGAAARDIRKTLERTAKSLSEGVRRTVMAQACPLHARNFSVDAAKAFHAGDSALGYSLLRHALALNRLSDW